MYFSSSSTKKIADVLAKGLQKKQFNKLIDTLAM